MRHGKKINHLGRTDSHRRAMLANMASSLILHKRINTTVAKAKALRTYFEPLVTKSKDDSTHSRRVVFSYLQDKVTTAMLFKEVAEKVADRPGGYTRIIKTGKRLGDNAEMCFIELVDFNEIMLAAKAAPKAKATRRRGGGSTKAKIVTASATETVALTASEEETESAVIETPENESVEITNNDEVSDSPEIDSADDSTTEESK